MKSILILFIFAAIVGCSKLKSSSSPQPRLGIIVSNVTEDELQNTDLEYKVLNKTHGVFEAYASKDTLSNLFTKDQLSSNQLVPIPKKNTLLENSISITDKNCEVYREALDTKFLKLSEEGEEPLAEENQISLGDEINLIVSSPEPISNFDWQVEIPFFSLGSILSSQTKGSTRFIPDALGVYEIQFRYVSLGSCLQTSVQFNVTANPHYQDLTIPEQLKFENIQAHQLSEANVPFKIPEQKQKTIVAVIDTGVNYNSLYLNQKMAINKNEIPNNGIDDDKNGFTDDYIGYDFSNNDAHPFDDSGHGSHLAGLIAAEGFGSAYNVEILPLKAGNSFGVDKGSVIAAIFYAVDRGAKVINLSLGWPSEGNPPSALELQAYKYAEANDVLIVTAAGNGASGFGFDLGDAPIYPASYNGPNILTVAASSESLKPITFYTNFGENVDLVAPGGDQLKGLDSVTLQNPKNKKFASEFGTSMAAAMVSALAAEVYSLNPNLKVEEVKSLIIENGDFDPNLEGIIKSQRTLNFESTLNAIPRPCSQ